MNEREDELDWKNTEDGIIDEVKDFAKASNEFYGEFYKRVKNDRKFEAGEQWYKNDETNRGKNRAQVTINLCSVFVNAVVNPFSSMPFKFKAVPRYNTDIAVNANGEAGTLDVETGMANVGFSAEKIKEECVKLNDHLSKLQNDFCTNESNAMGFHDSVSTGIGFSYATIDEVMGEKVIKYLHIEDQTMVILDPDAKGVALQEADRIAVVDFMLYKKAKEVYGDDVVRSNKAEKARLTDFGASWEVPKDHVAVVTYYRRDGHDVEYFRLCGDSIVDYGVFEGLEYLPIFAFTGDRVWVKDKRTFSGIIRKVMSEQLIVNYSQSQLIERLAKSPKGFFLGYTESFEGNEECFQNAEFGTSQVVEANWQASDKKTVLPLPQFVEPKIVTADLQSIIDQSINQMSVATGISPNGIVEQNLTDQKTATEVLLRTKSSQSNVSNYISHAKETIRIAGNVIAHLCIMLYGLDLPKGSYDIVVEEGCVSLTKMEEDREKLLALAQIVPDSFKPLISQRLVRTLDIEGGKELSDMLYNMLPAELRGGVPSWQEFQAQQMQMQELQQQLLQAQQQNKQLNDQLTQAQLRTQTDLIMEDKRFEHDVQKMLIQNSEKEKVDAQKVLLEAKREQVANEQEMKKIAMENQAKITEKALDTVAKENAPQEKEYPVFP